MKRLSQTTLLISILISTFTLSGCGGGDSSSSPTKTPTQAVADLRASGALPTLDRSTSVQGTDTNSNGIRDDVDTWITTKNLSPSVAAPVKVFAASMQSALSVDTTNQQALVAVNNKMMSSIACTMSKTTAAEEAVQIIRDIRSITANTKERSAAYMAYNEALNGFVTKVPSNTEACNAQ